MQQPVTLLEQGLETLTELVFVDVGELLQQLLHRGQFIPEPLHLQIVEDGAVVRLSRLPGGGALTLELLGPGGTLALALEPLLLQLLATLPHRRQLSSPALQILPSGPQLMLQVADAVLALVAFLFQEGAALTQRLQIAPTALDLLARFCQEIIELPETALMLLLLEVQGRPLLIVERLQMEQVPATGFDDLVGLVETCRQLPFATLVALDQLETGAGHLVLPLPECLQLIKQTRLLKQRAIGTGIARAMVELRGNRIRRGRDIGRSRTRIVSFGEDRRVEIARHG